MYMYYKQESMNRLKWLLTRWPTEIKKKKKKKFNKIIVTLHLYVGILESDG